LPSRVTATSLLPSTNEATDPQRCGEHACIGASAVVISDVPEIQTAARAFALSLNRA